MKGYGEISPVMVNHMAGYWSVELWSVNHDNIKQVVSSAREARKIARDWYAANEFDAWELNDQSGDDDI